MRSIEGHGQANRAAVSLSVMTRLLAQRPAIIPLVILFAGLVLRLAIAPLGAHPGDYATLTGWATALGAHSLADIYQFSDANYPPLAMALLASSRWLYILPAPGDLSGPLWMTLLKLPAILADTGIGWLVWRAIARRGGSLWGLAATVFNPALIYLSAWWGQYESVYMLGALAALLDARDGRFFWAGMWLGAGMMVKLQAVVVAPLLVTAAFQAAISGSTARNRLARLAGGFALPLIACLGPYAAAGRLWPVLLRLVALVSGPSWLTVNALNVWYVGSLGAGNWRYNAPLVFPDSALILPGLSAHDLGLILLGAWLAASLWMFVRSSLNEAAPGGSLALWASALLYLGVFLWPTQAHERYAFGAVVLMGAASACEDRSAKMHSRSELLFALITLLHTLNLVWAAPFSPMLDGWFAGNLVWGLGIALALIAAALWMLVIVRARRAI